MKVAIAMTAKNRVYHHNPCTAPKFAIYSIIKEKEEISFCLSAVFDNPSLKRGTTSFSEDEKNGSCSLESQQDFSHACEHYALLDVIGGSDYLLADKYCKNTLKSINNGGVSIYKIPSFVHDVDIAIKNFLIGANYANTVQDINDAS